MSVDIVNPLFAELVLQADLSTRAQTQFFRRILLVQRLPIDVFATQRAQQQSRTFGAALGEDLPVERAEDKQVVEAAPPCYCSAACNYVLKTRT